MLDQWSCHTSWKEGKPPRTQYDWVGGPIRIMALCHKYWMEKQEAPFQSFSHLAGQSKSWPCIAYIHSQWNIFHLSESPLHLTWLSQVSLSILSENVLYPWSPKLTISSLTMVFYIRQPSHNLKGQTWRPVVMQWDILVSVLAWASYSTSVVGLSNSKKFFLMAGISFT